MTGTIELRNPIKVGTEKETKLVKELAFDTETITVEQFQEAERKAAFVAAKRNMVVVDFLESNGTFLQIIGMYAIANVNPDIDMNDLSRLKGGDTMQLYRLGRNFIKPSAQEKDQEKESQEDCSEEPSEVMPEPTTATLENLEE